MASRYSWCDARPGRAVCSTLLPVTRRYLDARSGAQLVLSIENDLVVRHQATLDERHPFTAVADLDGALLNRLIGLDDVSKCSVRSALDDLRRYGQDVPTNPEQKAGVHELPGPKRVVRIVEFGLEPDRSRRCINLVVDEGNNTLSKPRRPVAVIGEDLEWPLRHLPGDLAKRVLWQPEHHRNRLNLRDNDQSVRVGSTDNVAPIHQSYSGAAADRRHDRRVSELYGRVVDCGLVSLHGRLKLNDQRTLRVDGLSGRIFTRGQSSRALIVEPGVRQQSFVACLRRLCLCKLCLKWTWVNLRQDVALVDVLAFDERYLVQVSVDPYLHRDIIECTDNSNTVKVHRYILTLHHRRLDGNARCRGSLRRRHCRLLPPQMPSRTTSRG